jgi:hypothetical protein
MKLNRFAHAIIGLALAAGIPLAAGNAPITHAGSNPTISATWKNGVITVHGSGFGTSDVVDVAVYNGVAAANTNPLTSNVITAQAPVCPTHSIVCILGGATISTTFTTLNPGACVPNQLNLYWYQVVAFDQTTGTASNIATVTPGCGTGQPTAPRSGGPLIAASLDSTTGVISVGGALFTSQGAVAVTLFQDGQPISTQQKTAAIPSPCNPWFCFPTFSTSFATGVTGCANQDYTVVAVDEVSHLVSNEVTVTNNSSQCIQ